MLIMKTVISWLSNLQASWRSKYIVSHISPLIPQMVKSVPRLMEIAPADNWEIQHVNHSLTDMDVLVIGPRNSPFTAILHLPASQSAILGFEHQKKICASLQADTRLGEWRRLLPNLIHEGQFQDKPYWIVERLPGINAADVMLDPNKRQIALHSSLGVVERLHQITAVEAVVDKKMLEELVIDPLQNIRNSTLIYYHPKSRYLLDRLEEQLSETLSCQQLTIGWIHGDYWPANILVTPDGSEVTGIVDWDLSQPTSLPSLDLVNLLISTRRIEEGNELGEILAGILTEGAWRQHEQIIWEHATQALGGRFPQLRESLLIFWLQHLNANLGKKRRHFINPVWVYSNFVQVLNSL